MHSQSGSWYHTYTLTLEVLNYITCMKITLIGVDCCCRQGPCLKRAQWRRCPVSGSRSPNEQLWYRYGILSHDMKLGFSYVDTVYTHHIYATLTVIWNCNCIISLSLPAGLSCHLLNAQSYLPTADCMCMGFY